MDWWVARALEYGGWPFVASWVFWVLASITLHELAHGWAAILCGDPTPKETGHLTVNPLIHMGGFSLMVFAVLGIAWGEMPVNPSRFKGRYDDAIVALAGPAMNVGLAMLSIVLGGIWIATGTGMVGDATYDHLHFFFFAGAMLNIVLFLFNLAPVPPLDGARIVECVVPASRNFYNGEAGQIFGIFVFIAIFYFGGRALYPSAAELSNGGILFVANLLR